MKIRKLLIVFAIAAVMLTLFTVTAFADGTNTVYEYYYEQLTSDEKLAYDVMRSNVETANSKDTNYPVEGFTGVKTVFSLVGKHIDSVSDFINLENGTSEFKDEADKGMQAILNASRAFLFDHPEYYWVNGTIQARVGGRTDSYSYYSDGIIANGNAYLTFAVGFTTPGAFEATQLAQIRAAISNIDATTGSDYDKVKKIHDYLCDLITYNHDMAENPNTYGPGNTKNAMLDNYTVCQGYAMAFKMACDTFGVKCICVPGNAENPNKGTKEPHMWNVVQINGKWYALDATWDDQISSIMRDFFLIGSDTEPVHFDKIAFETSHVVKFDDANFTAPELNDYSCVTLNTAAVDVSGNIKEPVKLRINTNISNNEGIGVDIADVKVVVDGVEASLEGDWFVSDAIRLDKALEDITIELYVGTDLVDSVEFSLKNNLNTVDDQLSKDVLQLISAIDIYNNGEGFTVTGATNFTSLEDRISTKQVYKKSVGDYVNAASLRIDENINVIFHNVCTNAVKAIISASDITTPVTIEENLEKIYTDDVSFIDLDRVFTIKLFGENDSLLAEATYSVLDYFESKINSSNQNLVSLCKALYVVYQDAANVQI